METKAEPTASKPAAPKPTASKAEAKGAAIKDQLAAILAQPNKLHAGSTVFCLFWTYFLGYFGYGMIWVVVFAVLWLSAQWWRDRELKAAVSRIHLNRETLEHNVQKVFAGNLPEWVKYPDVESVRWFQNAIDTLWPKLNQAIGETTKASINPTLEAAVPGGAIIKSLVLEDFDLGNVAPQFTGIKGYQGLSDKAMWDMHLDWRACNGQDPETGKDFGMIFTCTLAAGIKLHVQLDEIKIKGEMRIEFKDLVSVLPSFGAVAASFMTPPELDFRLTLLDSSFNMAHFPGLKGVIFSTINDALTEMMVFPHAYVYPVLNDVDYVSMAKQDALGMLTVKVYEATDLAKQGIGAFMGKRDPYIKLTMNPKGSKHYRTIKRTKVAEDQPTNPKFLEDFTFSVFSPETDTLLVEVWDRKRLSTDDLDGTFSLQVKDFTMTANQTFNKWFSFADAKTGKTGKNGKLHMEVTWQPFSKADDAEEKTIELKENAKKMYEDAKLAEDAAAAAVKAANTQKEREAAEQYLKTTQQYTANAKALEVKAEKEAAELVRKMSSGEILSSAAKSEAGELLVKIEKANHLPKMDFSLTSSGACDPYVLAQIVVGGEVKESQKTEVVEKHVLDPVFNKQFETFHVLRAKETELKVCLMDEEFGNDDLIGSFTLPIAQLQEMAGSVFHDTVVLQKGTHPRVAKHQGDITLSFQAKWHGC